VNRDPTPQLGLLCLHLAEHGVRWVLTGSFVLAACDERIVPRDVDVTPALDEENLVRLSRAMAALRPKDARENGPTLRPAATETDLDLLFLTDLGLVDIVPRMCGLYTELLAGAATVDVAGIPLSVCDPSQVLRRLEGRTLKLTQHLGRAEIYEELRARPALAVRPERFLALATR
jgi:hypothetical protein